MIITFICSLFIQTGVTAAKDKLQSLEKEEQEEKELQRKEASSLFSVIDAVVGAASE